MTLLDRIRCYLTGHDWHGWTAWNHAGRGVFVRTRDCGRCGTRTSEKDG